MWNTCFAFSWTNGVRILSELENNLLSDLPEDFGNLVYLEELIINDNLLIKKDTFNIKIYDKYGKPKGKGMTAIKKASFNIYKNFNFQKQGAYNIEIEQAFRTVNTIRIDSLTSLCSLGILIHEQIDKNE